MPTKLPLRAIRKSTYIINFIPKDENGDVITPDSVTYTLMDKHETVINSLEDVVVTPDTSMDVILSGDDLDFQASEKGTYEALRHFTVTAQYDSSLEDNVPLIDTATFYIIDPDART